MIFLRCWNTVTANLGGGWPPSGLNQSTSDLDRIVEKTFSSNEKVEDIRLDYHQAQYIYNDGQDFFFMDTETYEQPGIPAVIVGDAANFLVEQMPVKLTFFENEVLDIELPVSVELKVTQAEPAVKGDTATGVNKKVDYRNRFRSPGSFIHRS